MCIAHLSFHVNSTCTIQYWKCVLRMLMDWCWCWLKFIELMNFSVNLYVYYLFNEFKMSFIYSWRFLALSMLPLCSLCKSFCSLGNGMSCLSNFCQRRIPMSYLFSPRYLFFSFSINCLLSCLTEVSIAISAGWLNKRVFPFNLFNGSYWNCLGLSLVVEWWGLTGLCAIGGTFYSFHIIIVYGFYCGFSVSLILFSFSPYYPPFSQTKASYLGNVVYY